MAVRDTIHGVKRLRLFAYHEAAFSLKVDLARIHLDKTEKTVAISKLRHIP